MMTWGGPGKNEPETIDASIARLRAALRDLGRAIRESREGRAFERFVGWLADRLGGS